MAFCINCGQELAEGAKFCANCGTAVNETNSSAQRRTTYEGEIHKCPNCGEVLESFVVNCPTCGYEFRGTKNSTSVREFAVKIEEIEKSRPTKSFGLKKMLEDQNEVSETDKRKISLIRSFVIPNTKEDLFEFLILASSNINMQRYNEFDSISESEQAVSDAWEAKFEQAYEKAKLSFGYTSEFQKIQSIYEKKNAQISDRKRKRKYYWIGIATFPILMIGLLGGLVFWITSADTNKIAKENERLDAIVEEVYDAIEDKNYILARAKAANLVFSGSTTDEGEQAAEKWDKTRSELLAIIDAEENGTEVDISEIDAPSSSNAKPEKSEQSSLPDNIDIPSDFITGYEEAEFSKFNSPASENGLGGCLIYIVGTLEKTEVLEADDTLTILGYVTDTDDNVWLVKMHVIPIVTENHYDAAVGKTVVCTVVYDGYSGTKEMPATTLNELMILDDGTVFNGMQKLLDE